MISTERTRERRRRRLYAAITGWVLLGAASTGIVACTTASADSPSVGSAAVWSSSSATATNPGTSGTESTGTAITSPTTSGSSDSAASSSGSAESTTAGGAESTTAAGTESSAAAASDYADGSYTATGSYRSPGGDESITITLTLAGDVVTAADGSADGSGPSAQYQEQFLANFAALIVGKDIDEVSLDKVAGSSLTSTGFNEAVETIKSDALA